MKPSWKNLGRRRSKVMKGSVRLASVVLMGVASASGLSYVAFVNQATVTAGRDRDRMAAYYAAEAGWPAPSYPPAMRVFGF